MPLTAYRRGMEMIREAIGPDSYLPGCGAPILPSVGLVDATRVSPDTAPRYEPGGGDLSMPSQRAAAVTGPSLTPKAQSRAPSTRTPRGPSTTAGPTTRAGAAAGPHAAEQRAGRARFGLSCADA